MKSKLKIFLLINIFVTIFFQKIVFANEITFEANVIDTSNKDIVVASGNVKILNNFGREITGDKLELDKNKKIHKLSGNIFYKDLLENKIYGDYLVIDENEGTYTFSENIIVEDSSNNIKINSDKVIYDELNAILYSNVRSIITDNFDNLITIEQFQFFTKKNQLIAQKVKIKDKELNKYEIDKIYYDLNEKKIYGKDVVINENNELLLSQKHLARSKSRSLIYEKNSTTLKKTVYTNCKKRDGGCPPWLIQADEIIHDSKKQIVNYNNAILKFYNVPVLYFPKFFHPDPTVQRQSGFLTPVLSASKKGSYLKLPYFLAISESSDFTFSPRLYENNNNLYQGEYRKVTKNSKHTFDASIKNDNPFLLRNNSTNTHFFSNSTIVSDFDFFENSKFDIKLQSVSDEKYLKKYNVKSPLIESQTTLNSIIKFEGSNDDLEVLISTEVYEDLSKKNENDRYEYILPNFNISKNLVTQLDGQVEFRSMGYNKLYETNIDEKVFVNDLIYKSLDYINNTGFISNFEVILKNFNANSKNSKSLKNKTENNLQGLFQYNSKLPMIKEGRNTRKALTPIFSVKLNPSNKNKDIKDDDRFVDYTNIYSINRLGSNQVLEGGQSISIGSEYKILSKFNNLNEIFSLNLAASFRDNENSDLPIKSSLGQKTSNIIGQSKIKINDFVDINYDFLSDNNLGNFNYHKIKSNFRVNNFVTSFEFIEENNDIGKESFVSNESSYAFNDQNNLLFRTRKNKKTNLTEYYDLIYQYKMDCLTAGIEYKKSYYTDEQIQPEESIFFSITFLPFNNSIDLPGIDK